MKQKYTLLKDETTGGLTIQEHAELSKDLFSLICEETYDAETIREALGKNRTALIDTLRTPNLYPISEYIDKIAEQIETLFEPSASPEETAPVELIFDDVELFKKEEVAAEPVSDESVEIEDLLEDDEDADEEILDDSEASSKDSDSSDDNDEASDDKNSVP